MSDLPLAKDPLREAFAAGWNDGWNAANQYTVDELARREAAIQRVRELHTQEVSELNEDEPFCSHCSHLCGTYAPYPCPTIAAIEGERP